MRRLLCVWLPGWPTLRLKRNGTAPERPIAPGRPLATVETARGLRRLAAVCPLAEAAGLRADMPLTQARAICPELDLADADPQGDHAALARLAAWAERYTPLAAADPPDGIMLDIAGCAHLFASPGRVASTGRDGEAALAADLLARLTVGSVVAHAAIAGSAAAAWALARWVPGLTVVPPGGEAAALASLPIGLLRLEPRCVAGLRRLGLRSVGELARLPRGEVSARFGPLPVLRLDHAHAAVAEPLAWPHPPPPWCERIAFAEPIATADDLARTLRLLAGRLCARLAAEVKGGREFTAGFLRVDGTRTTIAVATALPVRDPAYVARLLGAKLDRVDPGFGIDAATLAAAAVDPLAPPQAGLGDLASPTDVGLANLELAATLDDLANRLGPTNRRGETRLWRPAPYPSHIPERSVRRAAPLARQTGWEAAGWEAAWGKSGVDTEAPRPLRLLRRPEAIEATAPVPDDPPILFRWRGCLHRVRAASGPERIAAEWWRRTPPAPDAYKEPDDLKEPGAHREEADLVRDYYRVEDSDGARFWLFRTGRNAGAPGTQWYLHGLFG